MNEGKIAVRYAKALYTLAKDENKVEKIKDDLNNVSLILSQTSEFKDIIYNPVIKLSKKKEIFRLIFSKHLDKLSLQFIDLIIENKREQHLNSVARIFLDIYKSETGIKSAVLTTAVPIKDELKKSIIDLISNKLKVKIEFEEKIDEKIIGGFILGIEDMQIDASASTRLRNIKKELLNR